MSGISQPLVTIGLPVRNVGATVLPTLRSIFAQTFPAWQLLIVDDGSVDNTLEVVKRVRDPRVRILADGRNCGLPYRLNQIAAVAGTPYVARMDGDDLMHPERIGKQIVFLEENLSVNLVGTWTYVIDGMGKPIGVRDTPDGNPAPHEVLRRGRFTHPTVMARREWLLANPYDPDYPRAEDHELWCRTSGQDGFATLRQRLLFYRDYLGIDSSKYLQSCRTYRKILRRYGPVTTGPFATRRLIGSTYVKQWIYTAAAHSGAARILALTRNSAISPELVAECEKTLAALDQVMVPGLEAETRPCSSIPESPRTTLTAPSHFE